MISSLRLRLSQETRTLPPARMRHPAHVELAINRRMPSQQRSRCSRRFVAILSSEEGAGRPCCH